MKQFGLFFFFLTLGTIAVFSQNYIDTQYQISSDLDVTYGNAIDFAGNLRTLAYDVSYPVNDTPPVCGRPLIVLIHGGAFMLGDKSESTMETLRTQFAQRGYVAMSVNYRLGMYQTDKSLNCNISALGANWNCLNMADSAEWHRANHRAVQDVHGAIRYITSNRTSYKINANNVFVAGESAGGLIALGVGFIDDRSEMTGSSITTLSSVPAPNKMYENPCIVSMGLDTSISHMDFSRDSLGGYLGSINPPIIKNYTIRGVGSFYGAAFNNIFRSKKTVDPVLYMFHQPNDLIVPVNTNKVFHGFNSCVMNPPFNCQNLVNRPTAYGSDAIVSFVDSANKAGRNIKYQYDRTTNNANCATQILNPSTGGHQFDNLSLRSKNMATLFAAAIDTCSNSSVLPHTLMPHVVLRSNPISKDAELKIMYTVYSTHATLRLLTLTGLEIYKSDVRRSDHEKTIDLRKLNMISGVYLLEIRDGSSTVSNKLLITE